MNLFLDTNVILGWILDRKHAFGDEAKEIVKKAENRQCSLYMSGGTVYKLAYVLEKAGHKGSKLGQTMLKILTLIEVIPDNAAIYSKACQSSFNDLEDAFQYRLAESNSKLNFFITGNTKDFVPFSKRTLPVFNPKDFLKLVS